MDDEPLDADNTGLTPRDPTVEDVVTLCRELNRRGVRYVVVGGFAVWAHGHIRGTPPILTS